MCVCLRSHVIPLVHLTQWISKGQHHKDRRRGRDEERTERFHFELQYIQFRKNV